MNSVFLNLRENNYLHHTLNKIFKDIIEPLYGNQTSAISKITEGIDRECEFLFIDDKPVGLLVYKNFLQDEFNLKKAFELKTILLFERSIKLINVGQYLFQRAEDLARQYHAKHMYGTISCKMLGLLRYLRAQGWKELVQANSSDNRIDINVVYKELL